MKRDGLLALTTAALGVATLTGCVHAHGRNFKTQRVSDIRIGSTTEADVRAWFGEPAQTTVKDQRGLKATHYAYYYNHIQSNSWHKKRLLLIEMKDGVVHAFTFQSSMKDDDTDFVPDARESLKVGVATMATVEELLGQATTKGNWPSHILSSSIRERVPEGTRSFCGYARWMRKVDARVWQEHAKHLLFFFDSSGKLLVQDFSQSP